MPITPISIIDANVISGSARGRRIGIPTINVDPTQAPKDLKHGIYACWIKITGKKYRGAMHYGPRPAFNDSLTLEVHVLDATIALPPATVDIEIIARIRDILDFSNLAGLKEAIAADIAAVRGILQS